MSKKIQYPTPEWIDEYMEKHADDNNGEGVSMEDAEQAWWYKQVDLGNPTPDDLTPEQEKASKEARNIGKQTKTRAKGERKPRKENFDKQAIVEAIANALPELVGEVTISNKERTVDFSYNGVQYSVNLIAHRPPKMGG